MKKRAGFTIVEVLVAASIIVLLAGLISLVIGQSSKALRQARSTAEEFGAAQRAFDLMARRIGSATLNAYHEQRVEGDWLAASELRFATGQMRRLEPAPSPEHVGHGIFFQAPRDRRGNVESAAFPKTRGRQPQDPSLAGMEELLNSWGYFVEVSGGRTPGFLEDSEPPRVQPQLMEMREPPARLRIYGRTNGEPDYAGIEWLQDSLADRAQSRPMAANIAALIILPKLTNTEAARIAPDAGETERAAMLAPEYFYHSAETGPVESLNMRHRLPPQIELTMVALDDATVAKNYTAAEPDPFGVGDLFRDALELREDLKSLESRLLAREAHYRIFTTVITLRAAP